MEVGSGWKASPARAPPSGSLCQSDLKSADYADLEPIRRLRRFGANPQITQISQISCLFPILLPVPGSSFLVPHSSFLVPRSELKWPRRLAWAHRPEACATWG